MKQNSVPISELRSSGNGKGPARGQLGTLPLPELSRRVEIPAHRFHVLEVRVGDAWYGLPIERVQEIQPMVCCEPLPESPSWVVGTIRYRDHSVGVLHVKTRLEGGTSEITDDSVVAVVEDGSLFGLALEAVGQLVLVDPGEILSPPDDTEADRFFLGSVSATGHRRLRLLSARALAREFLPITGLETAGSDSGEQPEEVDPR